ncbi:MFS transporter [Bradyrhizobium hipponense]|uniref:MFS transporter n=1 Tax=Bradyrhizobium hipponense TaxID=2605638 RepID=A0A5S4YUE6_9BRAD|nr:MFS transporter [Bradyrhizobium hipponense]TYO67768.1 MFS transporter [Bradyrhizobium hipponense]
MARSHLSIGSSPAFTFVLTMGMVNLFGDMTYEGGGAMNGQFMATLGASAAVVSITAGVGEFLGYGLRSVAGYLADKTGRYWLVTFIGYAINLLAVPAMALAANWQVAALLVLAERIGRAMRKPTVEAMLSYTTGKHGRGWVYAVNTALDETGATLGPLIVALVLFLNGDYRTGYALLLISALLAFGALAIARINFPVPARLEQGRTAPARGLSRSYWLYMAAAACVAAGLMSYELIAYHLATAKIVAEHWIPVFLAFSTGCGVIASLVLGKLYDRAALPTLLVAVLLSALFSPFAFLGGFTAVLIGMVFWGIGYAIQDTLFKAVVASVLPEGERNLAFGLFYAGYGVGWLIGSVATGLLYDHSRVGLVAFAVLAQLLSLPLFVLAKRQESSAR